MELKPHLGSQESADGVLAETQAFFKFCGWGGGGGCLLSAVLKSGSVLYIGSMLVVFLISMDNTSDSCMCREMRREM